MQKLFIILLMNVWANGEPEIVQYGTSVLGDYYDTREECEARLIQLSDGEDLRKEKGIRGIVRTDTVFRAYDQAGSVVQQYSCLEVNLRNSN
ncbi:MAG: hypothetical protein VYE27_03460 [Pseudomonadota bacterium]|nr:hypothetical protein [Pseudomonadota bacterium]